MTTSNNRNFAKFIGIPVLGLIGLAFLAGGGGGSSEPEAKNAAEAAVVGDVVTIIYPRSTIMCGESRDSEMVHITGELVFSQTMRVENNASKAVEAEMAAQKHAMAKAYSCEWAPGKDDFRYAVKEKRIIGDETTQFHTARYCLKPLTVDNGDRCWWIEQRATWHPQIKRVYHTSSPQRDFNQQDVDRLMEVGRKLHPEDAASGKL